MKIKRYIFLVAALLLMGQGASAWSGSGNSASDPILIASPADWETLATSTDEYSDTFFKLTADITVTTMRTATFSGTFDGGGHTLTFNYTATGNNAAPFAYITGATIKNLRVAGTINSGYKFAAGIVAISDGGTITNCQSSVTINSSKSEDGTHGGLVADSYTGTLNITNCLFDGKLLGTTTTSCGGIVGWHNSNSTLKISNSLFAPAEMTIQTTGGAIFARNGVSKLTNCYYISDWAAATVQGTNANSMTAEALVAALNNGTKNWCVHRGNAIPVMVNLVINNKTEWDNFSSHAGNYENKYVQLNADISNITAMTSGTFQGIFDGNGHTLTVNLSGGGNVAPFQNLNGGTIMNLTVAGTVTSTTNFCSGLVAKATGGDCLIDNCVVNTNNTGVGFVGGVLAYCDGATSLTISNCIYGGTIAIQPNGKDENYSGGIFGWYNRTNLNLTMHNCLFKGDYTGNGQFHPIGVKKWDGAFSSLSCTNCYYTKNPANIDDAEKRTFTDGTKVYSIIAGTDVTISGLGTATSTYEHITVYSHGIKYNLNSTDYYYAGGDEVVSLNLAHGSKTGYTFSNYEVSGGGSLSNLTATSATLTMTAADQTINAVWTKNAMTLLNDDSGQSEGDKNDDRINAANGKVYDVTLSGRTLNKDKWNTLCVPFDISDPTTVFGTGVKVKTLSVYTNDGTTVTISFTDAATIEAGKPYIVMLPSGADDMVNPQFSGVTISNAALQGITAGDATFKGNYAPVALAKDDKTRLFLSSNKLYYPTAAVTVKPFRAYFELTSDVPTASGAPNLVIDFGEETTGVGELRIENRRIKNSFYDLQGRRLNGKPTQKGIYIHNGKLEVLK